MPMRVVYRELKVRSFIVLDYTVRIYPTSSMLFAILFRRSEFSCESSSDGDNENKQKRERNTLSRLAML